jgi:hypothetical protein
MVSIGFLGKHLVARGPHLHQYKRLEVDTPSINYIPLKIHKNYKILKIKKNITNGPHWTPNNKAKD